MTANIVYNYSFQHFLTFYGGICQKNDKYIFYKQKRVKFLPKVHFLSFFVQILAQKTKILKFKAIFLQSVRPNCHTSYTQQIGLTDCENIASNLRIFVFCAKILTKNEKK